ncbi:hypothetical protein [Bacillus toyonensis]|uniref:hypothetical protein n=1 Tax=Bacillus toyonensis TaxID=155322 RepID=UPI000BF7D2DD|nr:hypothetical protein [Bacillus toyonensis]PGF05116.1 hypothetical protein COM61_01430 [Bacillus toyonensis]
MLSGITSWIMEHKKTTLAIAGVVIIGIISYNAVADRQAQKEAEVSAEKSAKQENVKSDFDIEQEKLVKKHGAPKKGFRWTDDGKLQAIGDKGMTSEDVIYAYVRGLSTLDFSNAQRYSYKTDVVKSYQGFYEAEQDFTYNKNFQKGMYKQVLLSLRPNKIEDTALFADYKTSITMNIELLDLSNKDFWLKDKDKIFQDLKKYKVNERDTTKMKDYLFNYVLSYYSGEKPKTRNVKVNFVMQQTMDGSWLVTNDAELDALAKYQDGEIVVNQILDQFERWIGKSSEDVTPDAKIENTEIGNVNGNIENKKDSDNVNPYSRPNNDNDKINQNEPKDDAPTVIER